MRSREYLYLIVILTIGGGAGEKKDPTLAKIARMGHPSGTSGIIGFQQQAMLAGLFGIAVLPGKQIHKAAGTFHPYVEHDFARGRENLPPSLILFILRG
jgi:hypothetical protein